MTTSWSPDSWRSVTAQQQPEWPDSDALNRVLDKLHGYPPLVFAGEARSLRADLARVSRGEAFLLQAGDCAESFESFDANSIRERLQLILQMAVVLTYSGGLPVVKVGRIAGQFGKPRSSSTETIDGVEYPSFRGFIVNGPEANAESRVPNPDRLIQAYQQSAATLNLLRAFTKGGFADLERVNEWNRAFIAQSPQNARYEKIADGIHKAMAFMAACGVSTETAIQLAEVDFYTSHEALILGYEEALTRDDSTSGDMYDCSAHMVWLGERTRSIGDAHVEFARGIANPIGVKIGPSTTPDDIRSLCDVLDPNRDPGRLTLISRMGADTLGDKLPALLSAVKDEGFPVVWACDPMHGNTFTSSTGHKTRDFTQIMSEIATFFECHNAAGTVAGGVHVELTSDDVTECIGGAEQLGENELDLRYETVCDPRLNGRQSLDLAFEVAELLQGRQ